MESISDQRVTISGASDHVAGLDGITMTRNGGTGDLQVKSTLSKRTHSTSWEVNFESVVNLGLLEEAVQAQARFQVQAGAGKPEVECALCSVHRAVCVYSEHEARRSGGHALVYS